MKKGMFLSVALFMLSVGAYAMERSGRAATTVIPTTGDNLNYYRVSVSSASTAGGLGSTSGIIISSYSVARSNLVCRNLGPNPIYLGRLPFVVAASSLSYQVEVATWGVLSQFQTNSIDEVRAIGPNAQAGASVVTCVEER